MDPNWDRAAFILDCEKLLGGIRHKQSDDQSVFLQGGQNSVVVHCGGEHLHRTAELNFGPDPPAPTAASFTPVECEEYEGVMYRWRVIEYPGKNKRIASRQAFGIATLPSGNVALLQVHGRSEAALVRNFHNVFRSLINSFMRSS